MSVDTTRLIERLLQPEPPLNQVSPESDLIRAELEFISLCARERISGEKLRFQIFPEVFGKAVELRVRKAARTHQRRIAGKAFPGGLLTAAGRLIEFEFYEALATSEGKWVRGMTWYARAALALGQRRVLEVRWLAELQAVTSDKRHSLRRLLDEVASLCCQEIFLT